MFSPMRWFWFSVICQSRNKTNASAARSMAPDATINLSAVIGLLTKAAMAPSHPDINQAAHQGPSHGGVSNGRPGKLPCQISFIT